MGFGGGSAPDTRPPEFVREALFDQFEGFRPQFNDRLANPLTQNQQNTIGDFRSFLSTNPGQGLQDQAAKNFQGFANGRGVLDGNVRNLGGQLTSGALGNTAASRAGQLADSAQITPFLQQQFQAASSGLRDQFERNIEDIRGNAALSGLRGSTSLGRSLEDAETGLGRGLADLSSNIFSRGFENAANRQVQLTGLQGQLEQQNIGNRLSGAGLLDQGTERSIQASQIAPQIAAQQQALGSNRFQSLLGLADRERDAEFRPFSEFQSIINPGLGVASFDRGGGGGSTLGGGLSGAAGGALAGFAATGNPAGALVGGGLGALGGLLG